MSAILTPVLVGLALGVLTAIIIIEVFW